MTPEELEARLLYRDGLMLVLNKPAGLSVHRGPKGGASIEDDFDHLRFGLPRAPALAHRLDKETSGCLVLGRHRKALAQLGKLFKNGAIDKTYWAVIEGGPDADTGSIDLPLGRLDDTRGWWMKHDPEGKPSVTRWTALGRFSPPPCGEGSGVGVHPSNKIVDVSNNRTTPLPTLPHKGGGKITWLALEPLTGRTHQLRVHCAEMGWPILGDGIYGTAPRFGGPGLQLHAREIVVPLYKNRAPIKVVAPIAPHMKEWLARCGWPGEDESAFRIFTPERAAHAAQ